jgi:sugar/nucleoside kinase (ribokinase family)
VPGGSACNTIIGVGNLGNQARFIGKRGNDELGRKLEYSLINNSVEPCLNISETPSGRVLSIITPDAQRSMFTYLGAAAESLPEEMTEDKFKNAAIVHIEGYLLFNEKLLIAALESSKKAGAIVSLDLASFTVVESSKNILFEIVKDYVDIILANEDEARSYTDCIDEKEALNLLSQNTEIAVIKLGKRGSIISFNNEIFNIGIRGSGEALDTTGAGDLWASGFLYGIVNKLPIPTCGTLGAACGYEVCQVIGAHIPDEKWNNIKKEFNLKKSI